VTAKAIECALGNWRGLAHNLDDGPMPIDDNAAGNALRPLAVGRKNSLFVGSQRAGERGERAKAEQDAQSPVDRRVRRRGGP
jgi:transposase